jgi:hypothetical protein
MPSLINDYGCMYVVVCVLSCRTIFLQPVIRRGCFEYCKGLSALGLGLCRLKQDVQLRERRYSCAIMEHLQILLKTCCLRDNFSSD